MGVTIKRRHKFLAVAMVLTYGVVEILCCLVIHLTPVGAVFFYRPSPADYEAYLEIQDPEIGWRRSMSKETPDELGSRRTPAFPNPKTHPALIAITHPTTAALDKFIPFMAYSFRLLPTSPQAVAPRQHYAAVGSSIKSNPLRVSSLIELFLCTF